MKHTIHLLLLLGIVLFQGCSEDTPKLPSVITAEEVSWSYSETETTNEFLFVNNTPGVNTMWDFGNGQTATGTSGIAQYSSKGTYVVSIKILSAGGELNLTEEIVVENNNASFLEGPVFDYLAGGRTNVDGKIWVVDQYYPGHLGCGGTPEAATEWYAASANEKDGLGMYDDKFKFVMTENGLVFEQTTNGSVFANGGAANQLGSSADSDSEVTFENTTGTWAVSGDNNELLTISGGAFLGYFSGYPSEYTIITLDDDEFEVAWIGSGIVWFQRFVTEDNKTPEPANEPLPPISITTVLERFDASSYYEWILVGGNTTFDPLAVDPTNENATVGKHTRGNSDTWAATYIDLDGSIDFSNGVQLMVDVYVPSSNDYTVDTQESWITVPTEIDDFKTLEIKLQNYEKGGEAYLTQMSIKSDVLKDYEDQWVTLLFDFSDVYAVNSENVDKDLMNRIVLQYGGEGWSYANDIEIYFDNIMGLESTGTIVPAVSSASVAKYPVVTVQ